MCCALVSRVCPPSSCPLFSLLPHAFLLLAWLFVCVYPCPFSVAPCAGREAQGSRGQHHAAAAEGRGGGRGIPADAGTQRGRQGSRERRDAGTWGRCIPRVHGRNRGAHRVFCHNQAPQLCIRVRKPCHRSLVPDLDRTDCSDRQTSIVDTSPDALVASKRVFRARCSCSCCWCCCCCVGVFPSPILTDFLCPRLGFSPLCPVHTQKKLEEQAAKLREENEAAVKELRYKLMAEERRAHRMRVWQWIHAAKLSYLQAHELSSGHPCHATPRHATQPPALPFLSAGAHGLSRALKPKNDACLW